MLIYYNSLTGVTTVATIFVVEDKEGTTAVYDSSENMLTQDELAKMYSVYEPFGLTYDKEKDCFYYNGKLVKEFIDILASNGEEFASGKFEGAMRQMGSPDGEIEIKAIRDHTKPDANGYGKLTGIKVMK